MWEDHKWSWEDTAQDNIEGGEKGVSEGIHVPFYWSATNSQDRFVLVDEVERLHGDMSRYRRKEVCAFSNRKALDHGGDGNNRTVKGSSLKECSEQSRL